MKWLKSDVLMRFVTESNRIESINRNPTYTELAATEEFLSLTYIEIRHLENFVSACQKGAFLRLSDGDDVMVGSHHPPPGGPGIGYSLDDLLRRANDGADPYLIHTEYETLHPFIDGNGRSGRVLWAWQMHQQDKWQWVERYGFLCSFYYQALDHSDGRKVE